MKRFIASLLGLFILVALLLVIWQTSEASPPATPDGQAASSRIISDAVAAPDACTLSYTYTVSGGSIVTSTNLLAGSQCYGGCVVPVALPFPVTFYDQTYTDANVATQGICSLSPPIIRNRAALFHMRSLAHRCYRIGPTASTQAGVTPVKWRMALTAACSRP